MGRWTRTFPVSRRRPITVFRKRTRLEPFSSFPPVAPNRESKISKFNFEAYAVLEANPSQSSFSHSHFFFFCTDGDGVSSIPFVVQQNKILEGKIQRSPSRVAKTKKPDASSSSLPPSSSTAPSASTSALPPSTLSNAIFPGSYNSSGPQIFLRIRIQDTVDAAHLYTTISVCVRHSLFFSDDG